MDTQTNAPQEERQAAADVQAPVHQSFGPTEETYFDFHGDVDLSSEQSILSRINEIEQRLEEIDATSRSAVPFYGELMLLYQELGRQDGAAEASRHIAMIVDDPQDWWNAAMLYYQWSQRVQDQTSRDHFLIRSSQSFDEALKLSDNPEIKTDYSLVLSSRGEFAKALDILELVIVEESSSYRPLLYAGIILYQSDKKDESIAYIKRSIEKANSDDELSTIQSLVATTSIEI